MSGVEFSAVVPATEHERFKRALPMHGGVKWFINQVLKEFNDQMEDEALRERTRLAVQRSIDGF